MAKKVPNSPCVVKVANVLRTELLLALARREKEHMRSLFKMTARTPTKEV